MLNWIKLALLTLSFTLGSAFSWYLKDRQVVALKLAHANEVIQLNLQARARLDAAVIKLNKEQYDAQQRKKAIDAIVKSNNSELDRLRNSTTEALSRGEASLGSCINTSRTLGTLLNQCSKEYSEVAAAADGHYSDTIMLKNLIKEK